MSEEREPTGEYLEIAEETLLGDMRDALLDIFKNDSVKPWKDMPEHEQRALGNKIETRCRHIIGQAVALIAAKGFPTIQAELEKVTIKDSYQCVLNVSKHIEERHALADAAGHIVMITVANDGDFMGAEEVEVDLDQPDLPVADACKNIPQDEAA